MEEIHFSGHISNTPGAIVRPKSMCVPDRGYYRDMHGVCSERISSEKSVHGQTSSSSSFLNNTNKQVCGGANDTGVPKNDSCNAVVSNYFFVWPEILSRLFKKNRVQSTYKAT